MSRNAFYITTAIDYVNAEPHMGHAYEKVGADAMARYQRLRGRDVRFTIGTDEHGQKVAEAAQAAGITPQAHCDKVSGRFVEAWRQLEISHDDFVRTTEPRHHVSVAELFRRIAAAGDLYEGDYIGWYCKFEETFWPESKLVEGKCPTCHRPVEQVAERNYFFRMSKFTKPLLDHFEAHPDFILPVSRRPEMLNIVQEGLEDLSISRANVKWGIPLPSDPAHVVYVWFDALTNYITSVGFPSDQPRFDSFWPADYHVIGKDIAKFHTIIWPAMLLSAGLPLPKHVFIHGFVLTPTGKMSKSLGNAIAPGLLAERYGADALRYTLLREIAWGQDGVMSEEILQNRYNRDLANDLGNLLHRVTNLVEKHCQGVVPASTESGPLEAELAEAATRAATAAAAGYDEFAFHQALEGAWGLVRAANQYVEKSEPWKWAAGKAGDGDRAGAAPTPERARARLETILAHGADALQLSATMLFPVIPAAAVKIRQALGLEGSFQWDSKPVLGAGVTGRTVTKGQPLFPRLDLEPTAAAVPAAAPATVTAPANAPTAPTIAKATTKAAAAAPAIELAYDDFMKADLRIAKVLTAEKVEKADKLLRLTVSLGEETRTLVAGIAQSYTPESLVGKTVVVVANLAPAKIRGVESRGMILAATDAEGRHHVVSPDGEVLPGAKVK